MSTIEGKYILWDNDGVLIDSEPLYFEATRQAMQELGVVLDRDEFLRLSVRGLAPWGLAREAGVAASVVLRQRERRNALYQEKLAGADLLIDGAEEAVALLSRQFSMAVVTTARRPDFLLSHEQTGLLEFFDFFLTREDYGESKPNPEPYETALARFGASGEEAIAIEDSRRGLLAAHAAGIRCIVVRNHFTAEQDFSEAIRVLDSIRELPAAVRFVA